MTNATRPTPKAPDKNDKLVGQRIRVARLSEKMSQTDLADGLGITFQQVQKYENGANRVSAGRLSKIAEATKQPVSYFFGSDDPKSISSANVNVGLSFLETAGAVRLVRAYAAIENAATRRKLVEIAEAVAECATVR